MKRKRVINIMTVLIGVVLIIGIIFGVRLATWTPVWFGLGSALCVFVLMIYIGKWMYEYEEAMKYQQEHLERGRKQTMQEVQDFSRNEKKN